MWEYCKALNYQLIKKDKISSCFVQGPDGVLPEQLRPLHHLHRHRPHDGLREKLQDLRRHKPHPSSRP